MPYITINAEGCKACTLCIEFCPKKCIAISEKLNSRGFHPAEPIDPAHQCTGCRICATMCPDVCIDVFREQRTAATPAQVESHE